MENNENVDVKPVDEQSQVEQETQQFEEESKETQHDEQNEHETNSSENEENNLTESIINIQSVPDNNEENTNETVEPQHEQKNYEGTNLTESIVDVHSVPHSIDEEKTTPRANSPPPPNEMTDLNQQAENPITDSMIEVKTEQIQVDQDKISITQSTLVLTKSQFLNEENAELESINHANVEQKEININTESMIVTNLSSEASSFVSSPINSDRPDYEEESKQDENVLETKQEIEQAKQTAKERDEVEKLVKEYEIPNFNENVLKNEVDKFTQEVTSKLEEVRGSTEEQLKEALEKVPEKRIENEQYVKILGNDSLQKKILNYGDDIAGRPTNGQMVTVSFEAFLKDNREKLVDHSDNLSFILGDGDVISGMDMVVSLMDKDETCELIVESRLAYGDLGKQPDIPPKADLVYKIHLIDFRDLNELNEMGPVERLSLAEAKKMRGNFHYNRQDFYNAISSYKKGLKYYGENNLRGDEQEEDLEKFMELSQALLMNTALSYFKMNELRPALDSLEQVLSAQKNHIKALYIRGKILLQMGETEEAVKSLNQAVQLDPSNADIRKELTKAQAKHKIQYENEKKMYQKMISGASKTDEAKKTKTSKKKESNYTNYVAAGLAVAVASIGVALFARYKNLF